MQPLPTPLDALDPEERALLRGYLEPVRYDQDAEIMRAGAAGDGCLFVDEGLVRLEAPLDHLDNDVTLGYVEPGQILGELSLLDAQPRSVSAFAAEPVAGRWLTAASLDHLIAGRPALGAALLRALGGDAARKLRGTSTSLVDRLVVEGTDPEVEDLVARAKRAQAAFVDASEEAVDALLRDLADTFMAAARDLAENTVAQTKLGNVDDKTIKNAFAARGVHAALAGQVGMGVLGDPAAPVVDLAAPVGVVFGIIPVTNPVATAVFKILSCLKSRNAIVLSFHRVCLGLAEETGQIAQDVLARHGFPEDLVLWVRERASRQKTAIFMRHPDVALILATGGPGMVEAAYSSGTPAIGVGSGNAPCWVAADADLEAAARAIVASKAFDHGLICGAEHNLIVDASVAEAFSDALRASGAAVLDPAESQRFLDAVTDDRGDGFRPDMFGQSAATIAGALGIHRDHDIRVIVLRTEPDLSSPVTSEKMSPVLSLFTVDDDDAALELSAALLRKMGRGHTAIVHTSSDERALRFARTVDASRILVNSPGSQGVCGLTTDLPPSFTLGCGTFGGNSTSDNVTYANLRNVKRLARVVERDPTFGLD